MTRVLAKYNLSLINSYIFGLYGLFISTSVSISSFLAYLMLLIFLIEGNYKEKFFHIQSNPFVYAIMAFVGLHFLGLLWTEDFEGAKNILKREWKLLFILLFMMVVKKEHIRYYLELFIVGMSISELVSYAIWFEVIPPFMYATLEMPTPFMRHLSYNIYLALAIYLLLHFLIFDNKLTNKSKMIGLFFLLTMSINMFITGGRAGQIAFLILLSVMVYSLIKQNFKIALLICLGAILGVIIAYYSSPVFFERTNKAFYDIVNFEKEHNTSVGTRMALAINTLELIKGHPFLGVGTGDLLTEYEQINNVSRYKTPVMHPHNMYLLVLAQFGILGFLILVFLFYSKYKIALWKNDEWQNFRFAFIIMFLAIMLSNSYLYTHHTMVLYIFFTSFLFNFNTAQK